MKKPVLALLMIITLASTALTANSTLIKDSFEDGKATSSLLKTWTFTLTAEDLLGNTLRNNGKGTFYAAIEENYLVKAALEEAPTPIAEYFSVFANLYQDKNFLGSVNSQENALEFLLSGNHTFSLLKGLSFDFCDSSLKIPWGKTQIGVEAIPAVPEPSTIMLFGTGLIGLAGLAGTKRRT